MKKVVCVMLTVMCFLSVLTGCSKNEGPYQKGEKLYTVIDDKNINNINQTLPKQIVVTIDNGGQQKVIKFSKEEYIKELIDLFTSIKVGSNSKEVSSDRYNEIKFVFENDQNSVLSFNLYDIEVSDQGVDYSYELKGIDKFFDKAIEISKSKGTITPKETANIEFEKYSDSNININIPKGWKVSILDGVSVDFYTFKVYNPKDSRYQFFFNMKNEGCMASQKDKDFMTRWYPTSPFAKLPVINPHNCQGFYKVFNAMSDNNTENFTFPLINEFTVIETLGTNMTGGDIVRATCKDEKNNKLDGIFTTTVKTVSLYYATTTSVYNTTFFTAPEGMLIEWEPIYNKMLASFSFTDAYTSQFYNIQDSILKTTTSNQNIYNQMSDTITKGWEARQSTYDTISQKQSDATLGYERVYDVETGDIYKAQNGFMDSYSGDELKPISDEMYNLPISGYIE